MGGGSWRRRGRGAGAAGRGGKARPLTQMSPGPRAARTELLAPPASLHNPVDMLAAASPQQYANCLQILLADPGVHSVMGILPPPRMHTAGGLAPAIIPALYTD